MSESLIAITMPKWGLAMKEGAILQWLKNEGDEVKKGEVLVEIETDANLEFAGITIVSLVIVNSELIVAVPETVRGIIISFPETSVVVAVSFTSVLEFSAISSELKDITTFSGSSSSFIVTV